MHNKLTKLFIIHCCLFLSIYNISLATEEPTLEDTKELLQKGLTIYEIDQEVERLTNKEKQTSHETKEVEQEIAIQQLLVNQTKERAGSILRSYYMGERDSLLMLFFSMDNLSEALAVLEFVHMIFNNDQKTLDDYLASYLDLKNLYQQLVNTQSSLQEIKQQFLMQRETLVRLQAELNLELENHPETDRLTRLIEQLTLEWQNKGLPVFRTYFKALAEAMEQLPEIQAMYSNVISLRGTNIQFQITDTQLNEFLISKNKIFENFEFEFNVESIEAKGKHEDMAAIVQGHYSLEREAESVIRFHIDELIYNGFSLPETTNRALEEQFDLSFYPEKISFLGFKLEATELHSESGVLQIILKFK